MPRVLPLAPVVAAASLAAACSDGPAMSGFTSAPSVTTAPASSSTGVQSSSSTTGVSDGSGSGGGTTSTSSGEDSTASASGTSSPGVPDMGPIPDFGGEPPGCQGKIDFLFVLSSWEDGLPYQDALNELMPHFINKVQSDFADFDYHIMVVDASTPGLPYCDACYMCEDCNGCADFGGPDDYPCDIELTECDVKKGAGVTFVGNFGGSNTRCELAGGNRYITSEEGDNLFDAFKCISTLGYGPGNLPTAMTRMMAAVQPDILGKYGCNAYFVRPDALLAVVILQGLAETKPDYPTWTWHKALKDAKKGNGDAIVTLVISSDRDVPGGYCQPPGGGTNHMRLFAEEEVEHGVFGSICAPSYVPYFDAAAAMILEQCSLLIPQ